MAQSLHVVTTGQGPTTLFVHGLDSDSGVWSRTVELLPDHRCVTVDLPGHGHSPEAAGPEGYERSAVLDALDVVMGELAPPITVVGHSLGGYLALAHVLTRPGAIKGLVLVSTGPGFRDPESREGWNERVRANAANYGVSELTASIAFHVDSVVIDQLTDVTIPTALVIGDGDKAYLGANDYMERKLPHASRTTVEGARHYVMRSHPEAVAAAIRSVTSEVAS